MQIRSIPALKRLFLLLAATLLVFSACQLSQNGATEDKVSFTNLYPTLSQYDSVVIIFNNPDGGFLDTVFTGKVASKADIENLPVKNWNGGEVLIEITGFNGKVAVYKIKKSYNGATDKTDSTFVIFTPGTKISSVTVDLQMKAGDSLALPAISITPDDLSDKTLLWTTPNPDIVSIGTKFVNALQPGSAKIIATLKTDATKSLTFQVTVSSGNKLPETLALSDDTLFLATGGASGHLTVQALPSGSSNAVTWNLSDSSIASVDADGMVLGLKKGKTALVAISKVKSSVLDSAWVLVSDPIAVESVKFLKESTELFIGGAAESLTVEVLPAKANPNVEFVLTDPTKLSLNANRISALAAGITSVIVKSKENPLKADTLSVTVTAAQKIDSVRISVGSLNLLTGGAIVPLTATVWPATASQQIQWLSSNATVAKVDGSGKVAPMAAGNIRIYAISTADSTQKDSINVAVKDPVVIDTTPPGQPKLLGASPTSQNPKWTWTSGGGGSGDFRFKLGASPTTADAETRNLEYTLSTAVSGTTYTLYVQERDAAGNWSSTASQGILFDATKPSVSIDSPTVAGAYYTTGSSVKLNGSASGPFAISKVSYKLDGGASSDASFASGKWSIASIPLTEGKLIALVITATDAANNTADVSATLMKDATAPAAPTIVIAPSPKSNQPLATWTWSAGSDPAPGSGLNGFYRYNLNNGAWSTPTQENIAKDLTLSAANSGLNIFYLQEQDNAGNWSLSATSTVKLDATGPVITLTSPNANPASLTTSHVIVTATVTDAGCPVSSVSVAGQVSGSGTLTQAATTWTSQSLTLAQGANTLNITATDSLGNATVLKATINVNVGKPVVIITSPANNNTFTSAASIVVNYTVNGTARTQSFNLNEGVDSLIVSSLPADNDLGTIGSDTVIVTKDGIKPGAPTLATTKSLTNGDPALTWTSGGDANSYAPAKFQYQYSKNGGAYSAFVGGTGNSFTVTGLGDGAYKFIVQEQDKAANWSSNSNEVAVTVDKTGPTIVVTTKDKITSLPNITLNYTVDGAAKSSVCNLNKDNSANTCTVSESDNLGNPTNLDVTIWRRSKVIFIREGGSGNLSGTSWDNASSDLNGFAYNDLLPEGTEIWVASGSYPNGMSVRGGPYLRTMFGGFNSATYPINANSRTKNNTYIGYGFAKGTAIIDGFVYQHGITLSYGNVIVITDCTFQSDTSGTPILSYFDSEQNLTLNNPTISGTKSSGSMIQFSSGMFTINNGSIENNFCIGTPAISMGGGELDLKGNLRVALNTVDGSNGQGTQVSISGGIIRVDASVTLAEAQIWNEGGTIFFH